jgi:hypothetical protein
MDYYDMTFIEVHGNEDRGALEKRIQEMLTPFGEGDLPYVRCGRTIVWRDKRFQHLEFLAGDRSLEYENNFFELVGWQVDRAMIMVGSLHDGVFTTPSQDGDEPAANFKEGGRCAARHLVQPFNLPDYEEED